MASGSQKRTRSERVAALELPPGQWERAWVRLRRRDVMGRMAMALLAAVAVCVIIRAWDPPLRFRMGFAPQRNITARVAFQQKNETETDLLRRQAASEVPFVFSQNPKPLEQLRLGAYTAIIEVTKDDSLNDKNRALWERFQSPLPEGQKPPPPAEEQARFQSFRKAVTGEENQKRLEAALRKAFEPWEKHGMQGSTDSLEKLRDYHLAEISVYPLGSPGMQELFKKSDVLLNEAAIRGALEEELKSKELADRIYAWLRPNLLAPKLPEGETAEKEQAPKPLTTLAYDEAETKKAQQARADGVPVKWNSFNPGDVLLKAGESTDATKFELLKLEYQAYLAQRLLLNRIARGTAVLVVVCVLFLLCGVYMRYRQRGPLARLGRLTSLLLLVVGTVAFAQWAKADPWRAELLPLMLFGMMMAIVYRQELALLLSGMLAWIVVLSLGEGLAAFLMLFGSTAAAVLSLGQIRTRSKLIYIGLFSGGVAALLDIAMNMIDNQPLGLPLLLDASWNGMWAVAAGFLMTGLLPFVEQAFGVLTDQSLLELGDITHPLLQELMRRAPSTYNHSMTVGSISEAAAESIGARGLLCRVGAYFHDIGKMLKPGYFVENQGNEGSRHDGLVPAMSTLVIVAHIKDGADLARQHRLPQPIIDMIQQHHGTTLVEYFYDRAHQQSESDPNGSEVDENTYRYPGPRPQTKEAAVLMLADAVESASRALVDPTPGRIEGLIRELSQRRLQAGQFDESGLTLRELRTIEKSMVMSVAAIYHGRLKYPEQRTA
jgi:putative nucleotidyltransferase with HDIG domain